MAPILKTYGKKKTRKKIEKEDTFDKLFKSTLPNQSSNIFESSSDREKTSGSNVGEKSVADSVKDKSIAFSQQTESSGTNVLSCPALEVSDLVLSPYTSTIKRMFEKNTKQSKIQKPRGSSKKKKTLPKKKQDLVNFDLGSVPSSTPKLFTICRQESICKIDKNVSPIELLNVDYNSQMVQGIGSPKGLKLEGLPKNILMSENSEGSNYNENESVDLFKSFFIASRQSTENFYGFPTLSESQFENNLDNIVELKLRASSSNQNDIEGVKGVIPEPSPRISRPAVKSQSLELSKSMQNLNISNEKDSRRIVKKSSSYEEIKLNKTEDNHSPVCKINIHPVLEDVNVDSSDIEESAVNSADERSCSIRSNQLDEEESAFHSSDEENVSGYSKDKDSYDFINQKSTSKGDSESAIFSGNTKDMSCNNPSEDVSADDYDLYTESEIAKSSDSIEVPKVPTNENISSDLSTSSDKELMNDELGLALCQSAISDKPGNSKQNLTRTFSMKSKDSSFYSMENSASDESELSFESDSELSCESSRSSRKSSLESAITLPKEALDQLRESISLMKVQDEYEDAICSKSRKSLAKRNSDWECPPSPRRSLFPLPENQEDPTEDSAQGQGSGSLCESTASEEDSHHSSTRKSRGKLRESLFRKREESGVEGRSSGEDDSTKSSPVRESSRLRRSRRLPRKSRESESRLNMVIEESDSESTEADIVPQMEHIVLPTGKKYRRSLSIIKHLGEENASLSMNRGRHFDQSIETVIKLQSKTGFESPCDGRKSLLIKRKSLISQCYTPCASPASGLSFRSKELFTSILGEGSPLTSRRSTRRFSSLLRPGAVDSNVSKMGFNITSSFIKEEEDEGELSRLDEEEKEDSSLKEKTSSVCGEEASLLLSPDKYETEVLEPADQDLHVNYEDLVFKVCQQTAPCPFSELLYGDWFEGSSKIGEGVYGEVFMIPRNNCRNVLKIIPIEGSLRVNDEKQKTYAEISNELLIAATLSDLRDENEEFMTSGFAEVIDLSIVKGRYPKKLIQLWNEYDETKGSDNDSPTIFGSDQLYLVLELGNAGTDLESYSFSTAKQGLSVFKQTVCALAVAEACTEFEHRDLHWGNVLVSRTSERDIPFILNKETHKVLTNGVKATIIDFTLSRMTFSCFPVYYDIGQDPDMFIGAGDYQFDIYRHMKEDVKNKWDSFVPKTNVRWLHYLVDKMIGKVRYQRKTAKVHTDSMKILKDIESWILSCDNAVQVALRIVQYK